MRTVAIIEARMRSTRLPGKVLKPILGRPMLELMIERLRRVPQLDAIVIATTADASCDPIEELAQRLGVGCFRGSEDDVLDRVLQAARSADAELIVDLTGDCPLIDPALVSEAIETFRQAGVDYATNGLNEPYLRGMDVQVFPRTVLEEADRATQDPADREHVTLYIYEHPERFKLLEVRNELAVKNTHLRLTVDTPADYDLVRSIFEALYPVNPAFGLPEIVDFFARNPAFTDLNAGIEQKSVR